MSRPTTGETPKRNIRIPNALWNDAKAKAKSDGKTITDVVVDALQKYTYRRQIPVTDEAVRLLRGHAADHPGGPVLPTRQVELATFVVPGQRKVLLDSDQVAEMLRRLSSSYRRTPLYTTVAVELEQMADELEMNTLKALHEDQ